MNQLYLIGRDAGVKVFLVNIDEPAEQDSVRKFYASKNIPVPVLRDPQVKTAEAYKVGPIPCFYVIGRDGVIRKVFLGYGSERDGEIRDEVQAALAPSR
jgi:peroxiredoxin